MILCFIFLFFYYFIIYFFVGAVCLFIPSFNAYAVEGVGRVDVRNITVPVTVYFLCAKQLIYC